MEEHAEIRATSNAGFFVSDVTTASLAVVLKKTETTDPTGSTSSEAYIKAGAADRSKANR